MSLPAKHFDAIVIGTGQSGPPLAVRMGKRGWSVAVVERARFGGTCVNYGCIPTKTLVASARVAHMARRAAEFGVVMPASTGAGATDIRVDMAKVHARMRAVAGASEQSVEAWMRTAAGVEVILGHAKFVGPQRMSIEGASGSREIEAPKIFLDVGGRASLPNIPGLTGPDAVPFLTNHGMLDLAELPEHLVILGGSYIGLEFGQMFRRFGSQVTVVERSPRFLPREDEDVGVEIRRILEAGGIAFHVGDAPAKVERAGKGLALSLASGARIEGSHLLVAVGRQPNTESLGLDQVGVKTDAHGYIEVDDQLRTNIEGIWALGDCNGKGAFTHTSYNDYEIAAANLLDDEPRRVSDRIPLYGMFIDPPLGRIGLNEAQVKARGKPALVGTMPTSRIGRARERSETDGLFKIHIDAETKEILGAAFLGIEADETVQLLAPLMMAKQPYTLLTHTMLIHPTVSELVPTLLEDFLKPLS